MTIARTIMVFRCNVKDRWNPNGCPAEGEYLSWTAACRDGWTGTMRNSRCPGHDPHAQLNGSSPSSTSSPIPPEGT